MGTFISRGFAFCLLTAAAALLSAAPASAQFFGGNGQQATTPQQVFNNGGGTSAVLPGMSQATPQQMQSIMMMRALQNRGRHQVRTGVPQNIPLGTGGTLGGPAPVQQMPLNNAVASKQKSSGKKTDVRATREEKKRAAKEAAKAKKEKAGKKAKSKDDQPADAS